MLGIEVDTQVNITGQEVREAHRKRLLNAADKGFAVANELAPEDRGKLRQSMFPPEWRQDRLVYGSSDIDYAASMEFGTEPGHTPPVEPLVEWAERIGKSEGFGWWVATEKIPESGVDAQPFLRPSTEAIDDYLNTHGLGEFIE